MESGEGRQTTITYTPVAIISLDGPLIGQSIGLQVRTLVSVRAKSQSICNDPSYNQELTFMHYIYSMGNKFTSNGKYGDHKQWL